MNIYSFFDAVIGFIYTTPRNCSIAVLNNIAKNHGCADNMVDQVINGAIADFIMNSIAPYNKNTTLRNGNKIPDNRVNPTYNELMNILIKEKFSDLSIGRAERIVGYLVEKSALTIDSDGILYNSKSLSQHQLIQL